MKLNNSNKNVLNLIQIFIYYLLNAYVSMNFIYFEINLRSRLI